jgi:hypothetical protein
MRRRYAEEVIMKTHRVYEVARELGVSLRDMRLAMAGLGYWARSDATPMAEDEVQGVIEHLRAQQSQLFSTEGHDTSE